MKIDYEEEEGERKIKFLYLFEEGKAESSFGVSVGAMAGLPRPLLEKAQARALRFQKDLETLRERHVSSRI